MAESRFDSLRCDHFYKTLMAPKTLYPAQQQAHDFFLQVLRSGASTLDSSEVGTGKTVVAGALAAALGGPVAVVSPKAVLVSWQRELAAWGVEPEFVLNYEALRGGRKRWLTKKHKHQFQWVLPQGTTLFWDEVHYCKSPKSQNGSMLIAAAQQGFRNHCMSATAAGSLVAEISVYPAPLSVRRSSAMLASRSSTIRILRIWPPQLWYRLMRLNRT